MQRGTYIKASGTSKLFFIKAENIAIAPNQNEFKKYGEALKYALTFPALPNGTKKVHSSGKREKWMEIQ